MPENLSPGDRLILDGREEEIFHQLARVFRAKVGDSLVLINKNTSSRGNPEAHYVITDISKKNINLELVKTRVLQEPLKFELTLALALPNKPAKLDMILQHCTELGVGHFKLIASDNSNYPHQLRPDRLEKIILEAVEQSERALIPSILFYQNLEDYIGLLDRPCFVALERMSGGENVLKSNIRTACEVLIGPEGGWSNREIALFHDHKLQPFSLGRSILRNETAAIVSCGLFALMLQN